MPIVQISLAAMVIGLFIFEIHETVEYFKAKNGVPKDYHHEDNPIVEDNKVNETLLLLDFIKKNMRYCSYGVIGLQIAK